jgi:hypothetical protein
MLAQERQVYVRRVKTRPFPSTGSFPAKAPPIRQYHSHLVQDRKFVARIVALRFAMLIRQALAAQVLRLDAGGMPDETTDMQRARREL